jgi:hypothetical protein
MSVMFFPGSGMQVSKLTAAGTRSLDTDPGVEPGSLALSSGSSLYWTTNGEARTAPLDEADSGREPRPDPAIGGSRRCNPRGSSTVAGSRRARVYRSYDPEFDDWHLFVCDLRSGARLDLAVFEPPEYTISATLARFAGAFVATALRQCVKADCSSSVTVIDLARGLAFRKGGGAGPVTDLVLAPGGEVAWIVDDEVHRCNASGCAPLGAARPRTLALSRKGRLYWTAFDGTPRSAPIG